MPVLARRGVALLVHAELPQFLRAHHGDAGSYRAYEATRPPEAEVRAIQMMARLALETGARVHVVHVSSAEGVDAIAAAQAGGIGISGETCPHYLSIADGDIPDGAVEFKCAPPIRTPRDRDALWRGLERGVLSLIATDHSPSPPHLKSPGDFASAWGGIASLELSLAVVWTAARGRGADAADVARWMSEAPAALAGLSNRKGRLSPGHDADVVVWDDKEEFVADAARLQQRHKMTPYAGRHLCGMVHMTFVRGRRVWDRGRLAEVASGQLL
jgi:allantoinase